jgi:hypothetical protein
LSYGEIWAADQLGLRAYVDQVALEVGEAVFGVLAGHGEKVVCEGSSKDVGSQADSDRSRREALAVIEDFARAPMHFVAGFSASRDDDGEDTVHPCGVSQEGGCGKQRGRLR